MMACVYLMAGYKHSIMSASRRLLYCCRVHVITSIGHDWPAGPKTTLWISNDGKNEIQYSSCVSHSFLLLERTFILLWLTRWTSMDKQKITCLNFEPMGSRYRIRRLQTRFWLDDKSILCQMNVWSSSAASFSYFHTCFLLPLPKTVK